MPKYSNPGGTTYSDETVRRLAAMECAADDFRIFWDNAYCVHHLFDDAAEQDQLLDIAAACREAGTEDRCFKFASTSKVTFPGAGISALAASPANIAEIKKRVGVQTIGHDKLNQLRHVRFLRDAEGLAAHMAKHAAILRPKFELVNAKLQEGLDEVGGCSWSNPRGGYFVSFDAPQGCAKRVVTLAKEAGEDAAEKAEEEPAVEKVTAEEIIGEPEEVVAEETVDTAGDVLEERVEGAVETVTEEEPAETLTDAADEAMAAFEASLSGLSLDFAEETSSDAPEN